MYKDLKNLILKAKLEQAIDKLIDATSDSKFDDYTNSIISISAQYQELKSQIMSGVLTEQQKNLQKNIITQRFLQLLDLLRNDKIITTESDQNSENPCDRLKSEAQTLISKLSYLREELIKAIDPNVKFKLGLDIAELEKKLEKLKEEIIENNCQ